jgi:hypothetical protein
MACYPHYCSWNIQPSCTGNQPPGARNGYTPFGTTGTPITAAAVESLRQAIHAELALWNAKYPGRVFYALNQYLAGDIVYSAHINELGEMVAQRDVVSEGPGNPFLALDYVPPLYYASIPAPNPDTYTPASDNVYQVAGNIISQAEWLSAVNALQVRFDQMRSNCICHGDCACNAVCACHGNCGCHYSDERLKQEIVRW